MIGTLQQVVDDMEKGVYNFCKDGKCIGCGKCCSSLLPLSKKEIKEIKRYMVKHNIKEHTHNMPMEIDFDVTCPFLDDSKECNKCDIYEVRPAICRVFQCNQPPSKVQANKHLFWRDRKGYDMREVFFERSKNNGRNY